MSLISKRIPTHLSCIHSLSFSLSPFECKLTCSKHLRCDAYMTDSRYTLWQNAFASSSNELCRNNLTSSADIISVMCQLHLHLFSLCRSPFRGKCFDHHNCTGVVRIARCAFHYLKFMMLGFGVKKWIMHAIAAAWETFCTTFFSEHWYFHATILTTAAQCAWYIKHIDAYRYNRCKSNLRFTEAMVSDATNQQNARQYLRCDIEFHRVYYAAWQSVMS